MNAGSVPARGIATANGVCSCDSSRACSCAPFVDPAVKIGRPATSSAVNDATATTASSYDQIGPLKTGNASSSWSMASRTPRHPLPTSHPSRFISSDFLFPSAGNSWWVFRRTHRWGDRLSHVSFIFLRYLSCCGVSWSSWKRKSICLRFCVVRLILYRTGPLSELLFYLLNTVKVEPWMYSWTMSFSISSYGKLMVARGDI